MKDIVKKMAVAASLIATTASLHAAADMCKKQPNGVINPSANPPMMDQDCDWFITVDVLAWRADQSGLAYAIDNENIPSSAGPTANASNFYNDEVRNLHFKTHFGFKLGLGYVFEQDGWDAHLNWTHFHCKANNHDEADDGTTETLFPLWSAYLFAAPVQNLQAVDIEAAWKLRLNMVDLELGRAFYTSRWLVLRPHIGLRGATIYQTYDLKHKGPQFTTGSSPADQITDNVDMKNKFKGLGVRAGLDSEWLLGCGWGIYGRAAIALLYGKFEVEQTETKGPAEIPLSGSVTNRILDIEDEYHVGRAITDLAIGISYQGVCNDGKANVYVALGWEHHVFFDQNQLVRINTIASTAPTTTSLRYTSYVPEDGDLSTQGVTLSLRFDF